MISISPKGEMRLRSNWEAIINGFVLDRGGGEGERGIMRRFQIIMNSEKSHSLESYESHCNST